ncbi:hypothetical protein A2U01_0110518, partial [Trifolium medium]|nr:hypothetical protein [Trifolium medium]
SDHTEKNVPADKSNDTDENVINVDDLNSGESPAEQTIAPSISKRLRSKSGKALITDDRTPKTTRKSGKKP